MWSGESGGEVCANWGGRNFMEFEREGNVLKKKKKILVKY